jgi:hypothetical protein
MTPPPPPLWVTLASYWRLDAALSRVWWTALYLTFRTPSAGDPRIF